MTQEIWISKIFYDFRKLMQIDNLFKEEIYHVT